MNYLTQPFYSFLSNQLVLISLFTIFIIPFSISYAGTGFSANYSFVLLPLSLIIFRQKIIVPDKKIVIMMLSYCCIFFISFFLQYDFYEYTHRRLISFIVFMSIFSYMLINITEDMVFAFKVALSCVCIYF